MTAPIVSSPLSFSGSARRLWRPVQRATAPVQKWLLGITMALTISVVWMLVACWYVVVFGIFGLFVFPYRLIRRGQRRNKPPKPQTPTPWN